jgi:hypothetical protein
MYEIVNNTKSPINLRQKTSKVWWIIPPEPGKPVEYGMESAEFSPCVVFTVGERKGGEEFEASWELLGVQGKDPISNVRTREPTPSLPI